MSAAATLIYARYLAQHSPAFTKIEDKAALADELAQLIDETYFPAWLAHPDYWPSMEDPHNPTVVAVFSHPFYQGHDESYVIAGVGDVLSPANIRWAARTLGEFKCLRPILPEMPVSKTRIAYISWSLQGKGNAFRCRERLKCLLPKRYRPLITMARRIERTPKWAYLKEWLHSERAGQPVDLKNKACLPTWYTATTRDVLNFQRFAEYAGSRANRLTNFITLENLWRAATGQVHSDDVQGLVTHQTSFLDD